MVVVRLRVVVSNFSSLTKKRIYLLVIAINPFFIFEFWSRKLPKGIKKSVRLKRWAATNLKDLCSLFDLRLRLSYRKLIPILGTTRLENLPEAEAILQIYMLRGCALELVPLDLCLLTSLTPYSKYYVPFYRAW